MYRFQLILDKFLVYTFIIYIKCILHHKVCTHLLKKNFIQSIQYNYFHFLNILSTIQHIYNSYNLYLKVHNNLKYNYTKVDYHFYFFRNILSMNLNYFFSNLSIFYYTFYKNRYLTIQNLNLNMIDIFIYFHKFGMVIHILNIDFLLHFYNIQMSINIIMYLNPNMKAVYKLSILIMYHIYDMRKNNLYKYYYY